MLYKYKHIYTPSPLTLYIQIRWASRWDVYLTMNHAVSDKVHWFSIINSVLIVLFLAFMVAMILVRSLNKDISSYNRVILPLT